LIFVNRKNVKVCKKRWNFVKGYDKIMKDN